MTADPAGRSRCNIQHDPIPCAFKNGLKPVHPRHKSCSTVRCAHKNPAAQYNQQTVAVLTAASCSLRAFPPLEPPTVPPTLWRSRPSSSSKSLPYFCRGVKGSSSKERGAQSREDAALSQGCWQGPRLLQVQLRITTKNSRKMYTNVMQAGCVLLTTHTLGRTCICEQSVLIDCSEEDGLRTQTHG